MASICQSKLRRRRRSLDDLPPWAPRNHSAQTFIAAAQIGGKCAAATRARDHQSTSTGIGDLSGGMLTTPREGDYGDQKARCKEGPSARP